MRAAMEFLHGGKLGKVRLARGLCYKLRLSIGKVEGPGDVPKTVDYDLWCGPAPKNPLARQSLHYDWHWQWDFGNGDLGNQGIHEMDKARWGLAKDALPRTVISLGGRFGYADDGETANTQVAIYDYDDCTLIFEVRGLPSKPVLGASVGNIFYGSEGYLVCPSYDKAAAFTPKGELIQKFEGSGDHAGNFVRAVRENKPELLTADIREGHLSSAPATSPTSATGSAPVPFGEKKDALENKDGAERWAGWKSTCTFKLPADDMKYRLGRKLTIDAKTEAVDDRADAQRRASIASRSWCRRRFRCRRSGRCPGRPPPSAESVATTEAWCRPTTWHPPLDQIEPALGHAGLVAVGADAADDEGVAAALEIVFLADVADHRRDGRILELQHLVAALAEHVVVLRIAVIVLVEGARADLEQAEQSRVHQLAQRPVDGGPADAEARFLHFINEPIGVEMVVLRENVLHHVALLISVLRLRPAGQVLPELAFRALRHFYRWEIHNPVTSTSPRVPQNQ